MTNLFRLSLLIFCCVLAFTTQAQSNLQKDSVFYESRKDTYQKYLDNTEFGRVLSVIDIQTLPAQVVIKLRISNEQDWVTFKTEYEKHFEIHPLQILLSKAAFITDLEEDSLALTLYLPSSTRADAKIYYDSLNVLRLTDVNYRGALKQSFSIDTSRLSKTTTAEAKGTIEKCKNKVGSALTSYYKKKYPKAKIELVTYRENEIKIKVWNIKNEISSRYYEAVFIKCTFKQEGNQIKVQTELQGKRGGGILPPKAVDYEDYEEVDKPALNNYLEKVQEMIYNSLTSKKKN